MNKKGKKKKPDLVVWDEERGYYPRELTYGSNNGAPAIRLDDVSGWKQNQANKANKVFNKKFEEIKDEFAHLIDEVKWNEFVYSTNYNFIPVMGETVFGWFKTKTRQFWSVPFVSQNDRMVYLEKVKEDIKRDLKA
jgi:hypothetical protein